MTPVLAGRLQTRLFVVCTVGVLWTALVTLVLPVPPGTGVGGAYRMTFESLGLMAALGLGWELVYHLLQQGRWDKDWPTLLGLVTVVNEGVALWFVDRALHVVPADATPFLSPFAIHVGSTWLLMWLFLQGPVRVLHIRWRFEGARVLMLAPGRRRRQDDWLDTRWLESLQATAITTDTGLPLADDESGDVVDLRRGGRAAGSMVEGVLCPRGHFGSADVPYCPVCGAMRTGTTAVLGPRPPLGVLILADGTTHTVAEDLVFVETADGITVVPSADEPSGDVLADLRLMGWQPVLSARQRRVSVLLPAGDRLTTATGVPVPLVPGAVVMVGEHEIRYESPYAADPDGVVAVADKEGVSVPVGGGGWTRAARRAAAVAAAVAVIAGAVTFVLLSGSSSKGRQPEAGRGPGSPLLPSFSVPPWTLPSQTSQPVPPSRPSTTLPGIGLPPIALPGPPSGPLLPLPEPTFGPTPPGGIVAPPPPRGGQPKPTTKPTTTATRPAPTTSPAPRPPSSNPPPPPISPVPTTVLCGVDLVGMLQCTLGELGG